MATLSTLPVEILLSILQSLDFSDLLSFLGTSNRFRLIFSDYHKQILQVYLSTIADPELASYFPIRYNSHQYPRPANPPLPIPASYREAFDALHYTRALLELSEDIEYLVETIHEDIAIIILEKLHLYHRNREANESNLAYIKAAIHRCIIINYQLGVYTDLVTSPESFAQAQFITGRPNQWTAIKRPPFPTAPLELASHLELTEYMDSAELIREAKIYCERRADLKTTTPALPADVATICFRSLRRLVQFHLMKYVRHHPIWRQATGMLFGDSRYRSDSIRVREEWFFLYACPPSLLLDVMRLCRPRASFNAFEKKVYWQVAAEIGRVYEGVCRGAHEFLVREKEVQAEERRARMVGRSMVTSAGTWPLPGGSERGSTVSVVPGVVVNGGAGHHEEDGGWI